MNARVITWHMPQVFLSANWQARLAFGSWGRDSSIIWQMKHLPSTFPEFLALRTLIAALHTPWRSLWEMSPSSSQTINWKKRKKRKKWRNPTVIGQVEPPTSGLCWRTRTVTRQWQWSQTPIVWTAAGMRARWRMTALTRQTQKWIWKVEARCWDH